MWDIDIGMFWLLVIFLKKKIFLRYKNKIIIWNCRKNDIGF